MMKYLVIGVLCAIYTWGLTVGYFCNYPTGVKFHTEPIQVRGVAFAEASMTVIAWPLVVPMVYFLSEKGRYGFKW